MSYEKAMKHHRNIRKCRKQNGMYMGFDSSTVKETPKQRKLVVQMMEVDRWFKARHEDGNPQHARECIRESIQVLRQIRQQFKGA